MLAHAAATLFMVGVIWFVRVVHYPLFAGVGRSGFAAHSGAHTRLTGLVVGPPMLLESATAVALPVRTPPGISVSLVRAGLVIPAGIRLSTVLQSPRHIILGDASTPSPHRSLVTPNRLRTVPLEPLRPHRVLDLVRGDGPEGGVEQPGRRPTDASLASGNKKWYI